MSSEILFYYFGDDEAYFRALQGEFKRHSNLPIRFLRFFETAEAQIQSFFVEIYQNRPAAVFIDFSKLTPEYMHLARLLARTPMEHQPVTVGLVDYLSPPEVISESIATGLQLTYIKSAETFDVVFDVINLIAPQGMPVHGFATAKVNEEYEAGIPCKVGFIHKDGLHIETNLDLTKGERIRVKHAWSANRIVPSRECFVREVSRSNLFYQFNFACDLDFLFIDEFVPVEGMDEASIRTRKQERDDLITYHRKQLKRWIENNLERSQEKIAKVLVVDREFHFFQNQQRTDKHPYIIRCLPYLDEMGEEIDRHRPKVIAFALDKEEVGTPKNTMEQLKKLAHLIRARFSELAPFIVVFNCPSSSSELQQELGYQSVMTSSSDLSVEVLLRMADIFEKKIASLMHTSSDSTEKVFLRKTSTDTICEALIKIQVSKISETDMIFQCDRALPEGINLHLTQPVNMYVHVRPVKSNAKSQEYQGLIHCLGEVEKRELRKYVNTIFFREHDGKKMEELDKFRALNEEKLKAKFEQEKAEQEASTEEKTPETEG